MFDIEKKNNDIGFDTYDKERLGEMINKYDQDMLKLVGNLYTATHGEKLNLEEIGSAVDALAKYNEKSEYNYLNNLLNPERCKGVKIPTPIPVPSCSFQLHNCVTLSPENSTGNLGVLFNPFFLVNNQWTANASSGGKPYPTQLYDKKGNKFYDDSTYVVPNGEIVYAPDKVTSLFVCNNNLSGTSSTRDSDWIPVNINQSIPPVYDQYRLVSASMVVKYIGRLDIVSGVIGGAIIFDENPFVGGTFYKTTGDGTKQINALIQDIDGPDNIRPPGIGKYGNFDLAMDSFYHQENSILEGIRQLYFPIDNTYEEYSKLLNEVSVEELSANSIEINSDELKSGFNFFIYTMGAPSGACLKLDIYCNYECLPNASFLNYMPISVSTFGMSNQEKKDAIATVQEKPIMKANETIEVQSPVSMGYRKYLNNMAKRFKGILPGVGKLVGMGLNYLVPKLKPTISIVGSLINSMSQAMNNNPVNMTTPTPTPSGMNVES